VGLDWVNSLSGHRSRHAASDPSYPCNQTASISAVA